MSEKKYVYANVRLPIALVGDQFEVMNHCMTVNFTPCNTVPEPVSYEDSELVKALFATPTPEMKEEIIKVFRKDREKRVPKSRQNTTFHKRGRRQCTAYTRRVYNKPSNSGTSDAGWLQCQTDEASPSES